MLSPRLVQAQGFGAGSTPFLIAVQGLWHVSSTENGPMGGGYLPPHVEPDRFDRQRTLLELDDEDILLIMAHLHRIVQ